MHSRASLSDTIPILPTLGLGVSLSIGAEPSSLQMLASSMPPQFIEYAGLANVDRIETFVSPLLDRNIPVLYHPSYLNFCGSFANSTEWLLATQEHIDYVNSPWLAQDCAYCFWRGEHGYSTQLGYFIPPIFNEASLEVAVARVREIKQHINVPIAIEPPPVVFVAGRMHLLEFFGRLANEADCAILLDAGHLVSWELASGKSLFSSAYSFPFERVIEVHVAGGKIQSTGNRQFYVDAHECDVLPSTWKMVESILSLTPHLKAVCYECEGMPQHSIVNMLEKLKSLIADVALNRDLIKKVEQMP